MNLASHFTFTEASNRRTLVWKVANNHVVRLLTCVLLVLLGNIAAVGQTQNSGNEKNVLIIYDEQTALPGLAILDQSIRSALSADTATKINVYSEGMDLSRFHDNGYDQLLRDYYK